MPNAEITRIMIVNMTLVKHLGLAPSFTDDDETELGATVDLVWQLVVDETFGLHDWTFCRKTAQLTPLQATPVTGYAYAFALPGDRVGDPLKVTRDARCTSPLRDFHIENTELHCNEAAVWLRFRQLVSPDAWDPAFRAAFIVALGSALAVPLTQDAKLAADLDQLAFGTPSQGRTGGMFGRLIAQNRTASPLGSPLLDSDPLTTARWS